MELVLRYRPLLGKIPSHIGTTKEMTIQLLSRIDPHYKNLFQIGLSKVKYNGQLLFKNFIYI